MKKTLLFVSCAVLSTALFSQNAKYERKSDPAKAPQNELFVGEAPLQQAVTPAQIEPFIPKKDANFVSVLPIGTSANAFGFFVDSRTANIAVNNSLNTISFTHRLQTPSGNYVGHDVSFDRGLTWQLNQVDYDPTVAGFFNARYPFGGIYNPEGNTNPLNAYQTFMAPLLDGSLGVANSWGGIGYGAKGFAPDATGAQSSFNSSGSTKWFLPSTYTITSKGEAWFVDEQRSWDGTTSTYIGLLNVARGTWDENQGNFDYNVQEWAFDVNPDDGINDVEIAFSPDGMTGYMSLLTNLPETLPFTSYHPVLFKTTDGGETWSENPIQVQLGGPGGLTAVQEFLSDDALAAYFDPDPVPSRDAIAYYMGYYHDLMVDAWGNPHLIGNILLADLEAGTINVGQGFVGIFHIWSNDGGITWQSYKLADIMQYKAEFVVGTSTGNHYSRGQISSTPDGTVLFFSWLDSDIPDAADNNRPDIYFRDFVPYAGANGTHSEIENVTVFSPAMWTANWATMPYNVFIQPVAANSVECTIPWVYQKLGAANDPGQPVQFYYISDFKKTYTITDLNENVPSEMAMVSQNQPNPFKNETTINVTLAKKTTLTLEVYNLTGQKVMGKNFGVLDQGVHPLRISADQLKSGVYFYTIQSEMGKVTKKMIVD